LAFARQQPIAPRVVDINVCVNDSLKLVQRLIEERIHLAWQPGSNIWPVKVDPSQINQILTNLCVNARDAIEGGGDISVETMNYFCDELCQLVNLGARTGEYVRINVRDSGCGIKQDALEHVFEPFYTTKEIGKRTGLGLATVYGIVSQNAGFILAESEVGKGSTFSIFLPRYAGAPDDEETGNNFDEQIPRGSETVLIVEDEPAILEIFSAVLTGAGYTVFATNKPYDAIEIAQKRNGCRFR
jgi:signal transduction histidine kinase